MLIFRAFFVEDIHIAILDELHSLVVNVFSNQSFLDGEDLFRVIKINALQVEQMQVLVVDENESLVVSSAKGCVDALYIQCF